MAFTLELSKEAPDFSLPGTDGKVHSLKDYEGSPILVVAFTCNHCPYVVGSEDRMISLAKAFAPRGVSWVSVNSNQADDYPEDGFDAMVDRAKAKAFPFDYLRDESQKTARAYGAVKTPHFFVFDKSRKLRYCGRLDDSPRHPGQETTAELKDALEALLAGKNPDPALTEAIGCTVKWKGKDSHFVPQEACDLD